MLLSIQQLTEKRKRWVEANRENNFEDGIKRLLTDLYPDNAHFIYELLQNAEDAKATEVRFILHDKRVEFEHNGERLFSIQDVESITSICASTKKDDPTNIGKFGVGFKAVFAYTTTPEIESGDYHFRISNLVVPDTEGLDTYSPGEKETRMIFPFDNPRKSPEDARFEIEKNLRTLNEGALLFLKHIRKIEYLLPDSSLGFIERTDTDRNRIKILVQHPEDSTPVAVVFLRFEKKVLVNDEDSSPKSCRIATAFSLEEIQAKEGVQWKVIPAQPGQVCIYFPAVKETSNLRFHLHAPFASTVARDSVRECQANNELRDHLANLIAESMITIRDQGLLTVEFLSTLPNKEDNLPIFYEPILIKIIEKFKNEKITPMKMGGHSAASGIFRGNAQLSNLINDDDLARILGKDYFLPMWVANPQQENQREDAFLSLLNIPEWTIENLVSEFSASDKITKLMTEKLDDWHQQLYTLLGDYLSKAPSYLYNETTWNRREKLAGLSIVRISDGSYKKGCECFFPSDGVENDQSIPRTAKGIYTSGNSEQQKEKAKEFLQKIGVRKVTEVEQIELILKNRYSQEAIVLKTFNPDIKDIKRFISLIEKDSSKAKLFSDYCIFKTSNEKWDKPNQIYLDAPFYCTGLSAYYKALDNKSHWALSQDYNECGISSEKIGDFAKLTGAQTVLEIVKTTCKENLKWNDLRLANGSRRTSPIDSDFYIPELNNILKNPNPELSKLVWETMCSTKEDHLIATYQINQSSGNRTATSQLVCHLKNAAWIPQKNGESLSFVNPSDASVEILPEGFSFKTGMKWLEVIEFGSNVRKQTEAYKSKKESAQQFGFNSPEEAEEMARLKKEHPEEFKKWKESFNQKTPDFSNKPNRNPERRQDKIEEQISKASSKEYETRERSVRTSTGVIDPKTKLKEDYTNEDKQMVCQICKEEMPFKGRDGEYYFEAVEMLSKEYFSKEYEAQFLALCPLCAAMYKEFVKADKNAMELLKNTIMNSKNLKVTLNLGKKTTTIRFVETHLFDLKEILKIESHMT